jgi:tRNA-2-methylthio-N6-dimethylallyladenosine synthase
MDEWPDKADSPFGTVIKVLGKPGEHNTEIHSILAQYGLPYEFPEGVEEFAEKIDTKIDSEEVKKRRLAEIVAVQRKHSLYRTQEFLGKTVEVLIEKESKKSDLEWSGRTQQNTVAVFPKEHYKIGDFVKVEILDCTSATLKGKAVG